LISIAIPIRRFCLAMAMAALLPTAARCQPDATGALHDTVLSGADLTGEAALQTKVSFEAKSQPLSALLRDLSKQGNAVLAAGAALHADDLRVTARVKAMPLGALLKELGGVYGAVWTKNALGEYLMELSAPSGQGEVEQKLPLLESVDTSLFLARQKNGGNDPRELINAVLDSVDEASLRKDGVAFSSLPPEVQQKVRDGLTQAVVFQLAHSLKRARIEEIEKNRLHVETAKTTTREENVRGWVTRSEPDHLKLAVQDSYSSGAGDVPLVEIHLRLHDSTQAIESGGASRIAIPASPDAPPIAVDSAPVAEDDKP